MKAVMIKDPTIAPVARRRPGRPVDQEDRREAILDVAEAVFAEQGYAGTSLRKVATSAGLTQAMITYYFGSKRGLFETVYKRRAAVIIEARTDLLDALLEKTAIPSVRSLVHAYIQPQFEMKHSGGQGQAFVRLQARLHTEFEVDAIQLRREIYDQSTKRFIRMFQKALPRLAASEVEWRMTFLIGTYLYMLSGVDRLGDLSDGRANADDKEEVLDHLVNFLVGGFEA